MSSNDNLDINIYGSSIQGFSHIKKSEECQDNIFIVDGSKFHKMKSAKIKRLNKPSYKKLSNDIKIISIADGHGSSSCPYSQKGSSIATNVFCDVMIEYANNFENKLDELFDFLNNEGNVTYITKYIVSEWVKRINNEWVKKEKTLLNKKKMVHSLSDNDNAITISKIQKISDEDIWKKYGTTLLGMLITKKFIFALQLGDGDIIYVDKDNFKPVIENEKILGVETHSISKPESWKKIKTKVIDLSNIDTESFMYIMSTDGWCNSHASKKDFIKSCKDYYFFIKENNIESEEKMENIMEDWLIETSELGCGDDITLVCIFSKKGGNKNSL